MPATKLHIAVVTETYPPEVNGVARTLQRVVEGLRERGHDIDVVRPRQPEADPADGRAAGGDILVRGFPMPLYPRLRVGLPARGLLHARWSRRRPDLVHIATEGPLGRSALRAARALGIPVSSDFRTNFHAYSTHYGVAWLRGAFEAYLRRFHNDCDLTTVPTAALARELSRSGFRNLQVIGRGVDARQFSPAHRSPALRRSWGVDPDTPVLLHVGRLAPEKNLAALVDAYRWIRGAGVEARLVVVGDGPLRPWLAEQVPDAILAGMQSGGNLAAHYASGDVFLFPSLTETFGNVTTEALASGLCVVACNHAAAGEVVRPGINGALVPVTEARGESFGRKAIDWLAPRLDGTEAWRPGSAVREAARQTALELSWESLTTRLEAVLVAVSRRESVVPEYAVTDSPA